MAATKNGIPQEEKDYFNGTPVFALKGVLGLIYKEMRIAAQYGHPFTHVVMIVDDPNKNFRHRLSPDYKGTRPLKATEYITQLALTYKMLETQGFHCLQIEDVESDDVIATISSKLFKAGIKNIIFSGDKDLLSLVNELTFEYSGRQDIVYDENKVMSKYGVSPSKMIDLLTLTGDAADNVNGVPKVGLKTAAKMLAELSLSQILLNPDKLQEIKFNSKNNIIEYIKNHQKDIKLANKLVRLKKDVKLNVNLNDFTKSEPVDTNFLELIV